MTNITHISRVNDPDEPSAVVIPKNHFIILGSMEARPEASEALRRAIYFVDGGEGEVDTVFMCIKNASEGYEWQEVGSGGGVNEQTTVTGDAPTFTFRTESDVNTDWGIINFERVDADGTSVVPDNTLIGVLNFRTPKTGGEFATLVRLAVSSQEAAGADGQGADLSLEAFDEFGTRVCQIGFDTGSAFGGKITINGGGDLAMNGGGDVTLSAGGNLTLTANGGALSLVGDLFADENDFFIRDAATATKTAQFQANQITAGQTRQFTFPDSDGTLGIKVSAPASAASAGVNGMWAEDDSFLYICTATNTWKRVAIASW